MIFHTEKIEHIMVGGELLMYLSCGLADTRIIDLDTFLNESHWVGKLSYWFILQSLWVEIKLNRESYLMGLFCSCCLF